LGGGKICPEENQKKMIDEPELTSNPEEAEERSPRRELEKLDAVCAEFAGHDVPLSVFHRVDRPGVAVYLYQSVETYADRPWVKQALVRAAKHPEVALEIAIDAYGRMGADQLGYIDLSPWKKVKAKVKEDVLKQHLQPSWMDAEWSSVVIGQAGITLEQLQDPNYQPDSFGDESAEGSPIKNPLVSKEPGGDPFWDDLLDTHATGPSDEADHDEVHQESPGPTSEPEQAWVLGEQTPSPLVEPPEVVSPWYESTEVHDRNPFEDDPNQLTGEEWALAHDITRVLTGRESTEDFTPEQKAFIEDIAGVVDHHFERFTHKLRAADLPLPEEAEILIDPKAHGVKLRPLQDTVRAIAAEYVAQRVEGDRGRVTDANTWYETKEGLRTALMKGLHEYLEAYRVDIQAYDLLYDELDRARRDNRELTEVYLGRDGVYAYFGRRAMEAAKNARRAEAEREVVKLEPRLRYVVYPSMFRDKLDKSLKREYLEDEGVTPETDPMYFDTGFVGSIPEDIMKVMGIPRRKHDAHIRLVSAETPTRQLKGIEDRKTNMVSVIEGHPKDEDAAAGLFRDQDGDLEHFAHPSPPADQLRFALVRQAIIRHYWIRERLAERS
jgi:hypothetical protein